MDQPFQQMAGFDGLLVVPLRHLEGVLQRLLRLYGKIVEVHLISFLNPPDHHKNKTTGQLPSVCRAIRKNSRFFYRKQQKTMKKWLKVNTTTRSPDFFSDQCCSAN